MQRISSLVDPAASRTDTSSWQREILDRGAADGLFMACVIAEEIGS